MTLPNLRLRPANANDASFLFELANDPGVRASSFSSDKITWEEHVQWLKRKLGDPACLLYIAVDEHSEAIGQVRFDFFSMEQCEISLGLLETARGKGLGKQLIETAISTMCGAKSCDEVHARVKTENVRSQGTFKACGFKEQGTEPAGNTTCIRYTLRVKGKI